MMEYIGATGAPVKIAAVPVDPAIDFHFLLSFAIDADPAGNPQNGVFSPYWSDTLTPAAVSAVKSLRPNVKALASLSGWSLAGKTLSWYDPADAQLWISNAFQSLKSLIQTYNLDGIDIDYERFPRKNQNATAGGGDFAYCIGELITMLKNQSVITVATIAPFYTTVGPYTELYEGYEDVIDYVNYQFYTDKVRRAAEYLVVFQNRTAEFGGGRKGKVLASYEVNGRGIQGDEFFVALRMLEDNGFVVNGAMIFSADASMSDGFYYEINTQHFLLYNSTRINESC
ncbi:chitinase 2-like [Andrographis paniculata]|uniref:chitinase 2-like n=1 Tax=Andrographis paniculata TaxID=175694 RepID=UPI0021E91915|nr:chitinase 2-like [Andrographis paniculata]